MIFPMRWLFHRILMKYVNRQIHFRCISLSSIVFSSKISTNIGSILEFEFEAGHMARFADGAAVVSQGDNAILATVVSKDESEGKNDFLPLTVDFKQSGSALGRIPTNFLRRELQMTDADVLASRTIDRSVRPFFPSNYFAETQIICKPLALDDDGDPVILGLNAVSAALNVSNVPWNGPVGAVRIGLIDDKVEVNPSREAMKNSIINMILVGCNDGKRIVMMEMDGKEISCESLAICLDKGSSAIGKVVGAIDELRANVGKEKRVVMEEQINEELIEQIKKMSEDRLYYILSDQKHDKISRDLAIKELMDDVTDSLEEEFSDELRQIFYELVKNTLRNMVLETGIRSDGRSVNDFRPIKIKVDVYKKLHGSALFQRGQTQILTTVTFDSPATAFHPDSISQLLGSQRRKMFMLHYDFPSYATNEIRAQSRKSRRELGHGNLAENALKHVMPEQFPYCTRLACEVLESNGSSSMASVCAGSLALLDAGVQLKAPVAGLALGLFLSDDQNNHKILTDLTGMEDYYGHMDFKIAGTYNGFTAMQLDLKLPGIERKIFDEAIIRGKEGISYVLDIMHEVQPMPRTSFKSSVPVFETIPIQIYKKQILFRSNAFNQKLIEAETGVKIAIEDEANISLLAPNKTKLEQAKILMNKIFEDEANIELTFGGLYKAEITEIVENGVMVKLAKGLKPMFLKNINLDVRRVAHATALGLEVGSIITVQYLGRDSITGQHRISRRTIQTTALPVENLTRK